MSVTNFKIKTGLDLDGLILTKNGSSLYVDGSPIAVSPNVNAIAEALGNGNNTDGIKLNSDGTGLTLDLATNMYGGDNSGLELYNGKLQTKTYDASAENTLTIGTNGVLQVQRSTLQNLMLPDMAGSGLYVNQNSAPHSLEVNTNVIATKAYVDSVAQGLDVKASVQIASIANLDFSSLGSADVDGVYLYTLAGGERILLKDQTTSSENGIYVVSNSGGTVSLSRSDDATFDETTAEGTLTKGSFVFVENGTNAGKGFVANPRIMQGTPYVTWTQFSEAGSISVGGDALYLSNNNIYANTNAIAATLANSNGTDGIELNADGTGLKVALSTSMYGGDNSGLELYNGKLQVKYNDLVNTPTVGLTSAGALTVNNTNLQNIMVPDMPGDGLYATQPGSAYVLAVNTNAIATTLAGTGLSVVNNTLAVDTNALATTLAGTGLSAVNNTLVTDANAISLALQSYTPYMVTYMKDGSAAATTNAVSAKRVYAQQTTSSNTFVTVATLDAPSAGTGAGAYNVDFFMKTTDGTYRKSMLSATCSDSGTLDYTEYAVIDSNPATTNPEVVLEYNSGSVILKAKTTLGLPGTIDFIAVVEYIHKD